MVFFEPAPNTNLEALIDCDVGVAGRSSVMMKEPQGMSRIMTLPNCWFAIRFLPFVEYDMLLPNFDSVNIFRKVLQQL